MLLSCRVLSNVSSVNDWTTGVPFRVTEGDTYRLYFQLIDASVDTTNQGFSPPGRRYVPEEGATLQVVLESLDDNLKVTRSAVAAYASDDRSIWYIAMTANDKITGTINMRLTLTQSGVKTYGSLQAAFGIESQQGF